MTLKNRVGRVKRTCSDEFKRHYCRTYDIDRLNNQVKILKGDIDLDFEWKSTPLVSIIITTYNRLRILKQAIESIKRFTDYPNYELIIVDDCSIERGMREYLLGLEKDFQGKCKILFNKRNMGFSKSNNNGIKAAKGDYVCLFNSDLIATEYWLTELVKLILLKEEIKAVGSKLLYPWNGRIQHAGVSFTKCYWKGIDGRYALPYNIHQGKPMDAHETICVKEYPAMGFSCALIEKKALEDVGLLPIGYEFGGYDDIETCMLMKKKGYKFYFCPTSVLYHYETAGMILHRDYRKNERKKALYFMKKWANDLKDIFEEQEEFIYNNIVLGKKEFRKKKVILNSFPQTIHVEASSLCNLKCIMCSQRWLKGEKKGNLDAKIFDKIEPYLKYPQHISLSGNGEPFVNRDILAYVDGIRERSKADVMITTNGTLLERYLEDRRFYKIDVLTISIDGATKKTYDSVRIRADFERLIEVIKKIERKKRELKIDKPKIYFEFVAMRRNIEELPSLVELAKKLGVWQMTVVYLTVHDKSLLEESLFYHRELANKIFDVARKRAKQLGLLLILPPSFGKFQKVKKEICLDPFNFLYVRWDGETRPCCGGLLPVGSLKKQSFEEVWNGQEMQVLRKSILSNKLQMACRECHDEKGIFDPNREKSHIQLL